MNCFYGMGGGRGYLRGTPVLLGFHELNALFLVDLGDNDHG